MSNHDHNRVLNRVGARELTKDEIQRIAGNGTSTFATAIGSLPQLNSDLDQ